MKKKMKKPVLNIMSYEKYLEWKKNAVNEETLKQARKPYVTPCMPKKKVLDQIMASEAFKQELAEIRHQDPNWLLLHSNTPETNAKLNIRII